VNSRSVKPASLTHAFTFLRRAEFLKESIASHDRQIVELTYRIAVQTANIDKLVVMSNRDGVDIASLARIAKSHNKRPDRLEGGRA
jgi:2-C-methyl-D-erythritol 4-phosphate cytidylyltransferase